MRDHVKSMKKLFHSFGMHQGLFRVRVGISAMARVSQRNEVGETRA